jgi:hypothetical protein
MLLSGRNLSHLACKYSRRRHSSLAAGSAKAATIDEDYRSLLRDIEGCSGATRLKTVSNLLTGVPITPLLTVAIAQFKKESNSNLTGRRRAIVPFDKSLYESSSAFTTITDSLLATNSSRVKDVISVTKTDMTAAHLLGAQRLLASCNLLYNSTFAQKELDLAESVANQWKASQAQPSPFVSLLDNQVNSRADLKRNSLRAEQEFVAHFTPWVLCMNSSARWHHADMIVKDISYKQTKTSNMRLIKSQILHLHDEIRNLRVLNQNVDYFCIGDIAMASFDAFRAIGQGEKSIQMLNELISAGGRNNYFAVLCCAVLCCAVLCSAVLFCTTLFPTSLLYSTLLCFALLS